MAPYHRLVCVFTLAACTAIGQVAGSSPSAIDQSNSIAEKSAVTWQEELFNLPVVRFITSLFEPVTPPATAPLAIPELHGDASAACPVTPLDAIEDSSAQQLEAGMGVDTVDVSDMAPAAAKALARFQSRVAAVGGTIVLKSAFRPSSYQQHLSNVWYKWMDELRNNYDPACQNLRAQVQEEFLRHHLIDTQHPVAVSDHTRGLAFDATVSLPSKRGKRRVSLDGLARMAGLIRPAIAADPVHFKFTGSVAPVRVATRVASARVRPVRATTRLASVRVASVRSRSRSRRMRA